MVASRRIRRARSINYSYLQQRRRLAYSDRPAALTPDMIAEGYDHVIQGAVQSQLKRAVRTRSDVSGLIQDIKLVLMKRRHNYDPSKGTVGSFIGRVAVNYMQDHFRLKAVRHDEELESLDELRGKGRQVQSTQRDLREEIEKANQRRDIQDVLKTLSPHERDLVRALVSFSTVTGAARSLGMNRMAFRTEWQKIKRKLEVRLRAYRDVA